MVLRSPTFVPAHTTPSQVLSQYNCCMEILGIGLRVLLGMPVFFYLPGLTLAGLFFGEAEPLAGTERHVHRIVVSMLLTGWLGLVLAEFGWFSYWLLLACVFALGVGAMLWRRSLPGWRRVQQRGAPSGLVAGWHGAQGAREALVSKLAVSRFDYWLLGIAFLFALLVIRPFEVVRGGLDAGVYANIAAAVVRTGGIVLYDPIVADIGQRAEAGDLQAQEVASNILGVQSKKRWLATRIRAAGFFITEGELAQGRIVPQFYHLWPSTLAIFVSMLGVAQGLVATGAAGLLGVVLLGLIGRRIAGSLAGLLAAAFLALMTPQVWFSRMSTSEALTQALLLAGLWAFTHFAEALDRKQRIWWGALTGVAFGQAALTRIDFPLALAPIFLLVIYVALTSRWHAGYTAMTLALGALVLHTALHTLLIARAYFFDTYYSILQKSVLTISLSLPFLSLELRDRFMFRGGSVYQEPGRVWIELALLVGIFLALFTLSRRPGLLLHAETWVRRRARLLLGGWVVLLGAFALYAYIIRPGILTLDVLRQPFDPAHWLRLQGYVGAPIDVPAGYRKETVALSFANMVRLGWYLSPLGVVLGTAGGLLLWWRLERRATLFVVIATVFAFFYIHSLYGTGEQTYIYILRRYVPLVYPAFALGIAHALSAIRGRATEGAGGIGRRLRDGVFATCGAALLLFFVVTGRSAYAHTEYEGMLAQVEAISRQVDPRDIILVRGGGADDVAVRDTSELIAAPLTYIYGQNALPVKGRIPAKYPAAFAGQVARWRDEGRQVYLLLAASGGDMLFPGFVPRSVGVWNLRLREFQQLQEQKPKLSYVNDVPFHLYELVPAGSIEPTLSFSYDDTAAQVAGFYRSEPGGNDQARAAWTDGLGVLRLPAAAQGQTATLRVAGGRRPQALGLARMCVDIVPEPTVYPEERVSGDALAWRELGCTDLDEQASNVPIDLPMLQAKSSLLLRLRSESWRPSEALVEPGASPSPDERRLGLRFLGADITR